MNEGFKYFVPYKSINTNKLTIQQGYVIYDELNNLNWMIEIESAN